MKVLLTSKDPKTYSISPMLGSKESLATKAEFTTGEGARISRRSLQTIIRRFDDGSIDGHTEPELDD